MNSDKAQRIVDDPGGWLADHHANQPDTKPEPGDGDLTVDQLRELTPEERLRAAEAGRLNWLLNPTTERN